MAIAGLGLAVAATGARAELDGPYIGGGLALNKATAKITDPDDTSTRGTLGHDSHEAGVNINGGWAWTIGSGFHIGAELSYQSGAGKAEGSLSGDTATGKVKNVMALSVLPGWKVNNTAVLFGRLGLAQAKFDINFPGESSSKTYGGTLVGVGAKVAFTKNLSGVVEYQNLILEEKDVTFSDGTRIKVQPGSTGVYLGLQYNFM